MSNRASKTRIAIGVVLGLLAASAATSRAAAGQHPSLLSPVPSPTAQSRMTYGSDLASFQGEAASDDVRLMAGWVRDNADNGDLPFAIIDKKAAKAFVFNGKGQLIGATPVLLGLARGDDSAAGIGSRKLANIRPEERTTAAGRFVADLGRNSDHQDVLWVDYRAALAMHRVLAGNSRERRMQENSAASPDAKRITFGCIEVPVKFFDQVVLPAFTGTSGVIYILPEIKSIPQVFFSADRVGIAEIQNPVPNSLLN